jgi:uncharacterized protein (TIGR03437 family)
VFPGEEIDLYAIGLGRTQDDFPTDRLFSAAFPLGTLPVVRFGEATVEASMATLVSPGLYVVRVPVPASLAAGEVPLTIEDRESATRPGAAEYRNFPKLGQRVTYGERTAR